MPVAAKANPHLAKVVPFKTVLTDFEKVANLSLRKLDVIPAATLTGMDLDAFQTDVKSWLDSAKRPRCHRLFNEPTSRCRDLAGSDCSDEGALVD